MHELARRARPIDPGERIARGLKYSTVGPIDVTRGALGVGVNSTQSSASWVANRYRRGRIKSQLRKDLAAAQERHRQRARRRPGGRHQHSAGAAGGPESRRRPRPLVLVGVGVAGPRRRRGVVLDHQAFDAADPSPLPPSVDVPPKP